MNMNMIMKYLYLLYQISHYQNASSYTTLPKIPSRGYWQSCTIYLLIYMIHYFYSFLCLCKNLADLGIVVGYVCIWS